MSDQACLTKKGRYAPPKAPQTPAGSSSLHPDHPRSESVPKATPAPLPASKYRSSSAYPTPLMVRKPEQGTGTRVKSMPPLDFHAATVPPPDLEEVGNPGSENLSESEGEKSSSNSDSAKSDGSNASDAYKGEDGDDEDGEDEEASNAVVRELAMEVIELDSSPRKKKKSAEFWNLRKLEDHIARLRRDATFEESDAEDSPVAPKPSLSKSALFKSSSSKVVAPKPTTFKSAAPKSTTSKAASSKSAAPEAVAPKSAAPKAVSSKFTPASGAASSKSVALKSTAPKHPSPPSDMSDIKMEEEMEEAKQEGDDPVVNKYNKVIVRSHVLKSMTSLCGFKKAQEAANITPLYEENGEPKWFK
ncbi:hypothetical protein FRC08_009098 [Ceratobasidium sp. 394]|nr:hypothetical protein FRC08_009098 [Ceratobasidium sp. 394]